MKRNRILSISLSLALLAGLLVAPAHAAYSDVEDHSAQAAVQRWSERKILLGNEMGQLLPDETLTRGAFSAMVDRLLGYSVMAENTFADLGEDHWYTPSMLRLNAVGVLNGNCNLAMPEAQVTRQEAVALLGRALGLEENTTPLPFTDKADVPDWATGYLSAVVERGCFSGETAFRPADTMTRAETVVMLDTLVSAYVNADGDYSADAKGTLVVNAKNVTLKNMKIGGDLIVADGVGEGDVSLDHVTVTGNIILRGGGANSFHILAGSEVGTITVTKTANGVIRVVNESGKVIPMINVADGRDGVTLTGEFKNVIIASDAPVTLVNATVKETVSVTAPSSSVTLSGTSSVKKLDVAKTAENATVALTDTAKVTNVIVSGNGLTLDNNSTNKKPTISVDNTLTDKPTASGGQEIKPTPPSDSGYTPPPLTTISSLTATLPSPQTGKTANDAVASGTGYTVSTTWSPVPIGGKFAVSTPYTATLTFALSGSYSQWAASPTVSVTNSTSYGDPPQVTRSEVVGSTYVVDVEYLPTAVLAIEASLEPGNTIEAVVGSTNTRSLSITAHVTADGDTAPNYPLAYQWYRVNDFTMPDNKTSIPGCTSRKFFLPADLAVGTHYFACGMTTEGVAEVLSSIVTVTVTAAPVDPPTPPTPPPEEVALSNLHLRSNDYNDCTGLVLEWDCLDPGQTTYQLEFFTADNEYPCATAYFSCEPGRFYTSLPDYTFNFSNTFYPFVISKLRLTPLRYYGNPSGPSVDFAYTIRADFGSSLSDVSAIFDTTTNLLELNTAAPSDFGIVYHYWVYNIDTNGIPYCVFGGTFDQNNSVSLADNPDNIAKIKAADAKIDVIGVSGVIGTDFDTGKPIGYLIFSSTGKLPIPIIASGT